MLDASVKKRKWSSKDTSKFTKAQGCMVFSVGNAMHYPLFKEQFIGEFVREGILEYIIPEPNMRLTPNPLVAAEIAVTEKPGPGAEPSRERVDGNMTNYETEVNELHERIINRINTAYPGESAAKTKLILTEQLELERKLGSRTEMLMKAEGNYCSILKIWQDKNELHLQRINKTCQIITDYIDKSVLQPYRDILDRKQYRRFYLSFDEHYSGKSSNEAVRFGLFTALYSIIMKGDNLDKYISYFNSVASECHLPDDDQTGHKKYILFNSIETSKYYDDYKSTIEHCKMNGLSFHDSIIFLKRRYMELTMKRGKKKSNLISDEKAMKATVKNEHANIIRNNNEVINQVKPTSVSINNMNIDNCPHCQKRHLYRDKCWKINKCPHCGLFGHNPDRCRNKDLRNTSNSKPNNNNASSNKNKKKAKKPNTGPGDNRQVSLEQKFRNTHSSVATNNDSDYDIDD